MVNVALVNDCLQTGHLCFKVKFYWNTAMPFCVLSSLLLRYNGRLDS